MLALEIQLIVLFLLVNHTNYAITVNKKHHLNHEKSASLFIEKFDRAFYQFFLARCAYELIHLSICSSLDLFISQLSNKQNHFCKQGLMKQEND